jgi:hypothetical protein
MPSFGIWLHVDLVRTDVSEERIATIFYPEDGNHTFLRKVGSHKSNTASHPRKRNSSDCCFIHRYFFPLSPELTGVIWKQLLGKQPSSRNFEDSVFETFR